MKTVQTVIAPFNTSNPKDFKKKHMFDIFGVCVGSFILAEILRVQVRLKEVQGGPTSIRNLPKGKEPK